MGFSAACALSLVNFFAGYSPATKILELMPMRAREATLDYVSRPTPQRPSALWLRDALAGVVCSGVVILSPQQAPRLLARALERVPAPPGPLHALNILSVVTCAALALPGALFALVGITYRHGFVDH